MGKLLHRWSSLQAGTRDRKSLKSKVPILLKKLTLKNISLSALGTIADLVPLKKKTELSPIRTQAFRLQSIVG